MTGEEKQFYGIDSLWGEMRTSREAQNSSSKNTHVKMIEERNVLYYMHLLFVFMYSFNNRQD